MENIKTMSTAIVAVLLGQLFHPATLRRQDQEMIRALPAAKTQQREKVEQWGSRAGQMKR
ncbi:MAG: hypothetical protein H0X62_06020 [Bacteroidetes bacterium]|nr:hypothetical protein [Bacteroidota bacterium]